MEAYQKAYYEYQTQARGLLEEKVLRQRFDKLALWYAHRLRAHLPISRSVACLDLPCGYGNFLYFLRQQGYQNIVGYDLDPAQVKLAKLLDLPVHEGDAFDVLSNTLNTWDCITSLDFIEHLSRDQVLKFLELCWARLRPGGVLILRTSCADGPFGAHDRYNDLTHQGAMTSNVLRTVMRMLNFERVEILDERPQAYNLLNTLRLLLFYPTRAFVSGLCLALGLAPPAVWSRAMWGVGYKPQIENKI
jgi:2-polyprenyl-3-methyl-5-hydroxy-6-metoxy-1,4-benzoquinol methylase